MDLNTLAAYASIAGFVTQSLLFVAGGYKLIKTASVRRLVFVLGLVITACLAFAFLSVRPFETADRLYAVAMDRFEHHNYPDAIAFCKRAIAKDRTHLAAHRSLASLLALSGKIPEAMAEFKATLEVDPLDVVAHLGAAKASEELGDQRTAMWHYSFIAQMTEVPSDAKDTAIKRLEALKRTGRH